MEKKLLAIELTVTLVTRDENGNVVKGKPITINIPMPDKEEGGYGTQQK